MTTRRLTFLLLSLLPVILGACKREATAAKAATTRTVVLLNARGDRGYEMAQSQQLARLAFAREGSNLKVLDAKGDSALQARQFDEAVAEKPAAILLSPVEAGALSTHVGDAVQAGVFVIGLGENAASLPCSTVLQVGQRDLGKLAGEVVAQALTRKAQEEGRTETTGRVVELRGDEHSAECQARHEGFMEALQKVPGAILVHDAPADWTGQGGKDRVREALRLQSQFDVIYAHSDAIALGAASMLGEQRVQMLVIGTDGFRGEEGGLTLVAQGNLDASIYQPPLVDLAWQIIERRLSEPGFVAKPVYRLNGLVITPKNVEDLRRGGFPALPAL
ncbi:MAG: substrate-binding domain-containing protein [Verrucomicrobiota bacterium]